MKSKSRFLTFILFTFVCFSAPRRADAIVMDVLGDVAKPLIGSAKESTQGLFKYIWLMPYAGYGFGNGNRISSRNGAVLNNYSGLTADGMMFGARGGLEIMETFRIGVDWTRQAGQREDYITVAAVSTKRTITSHNSMIGVTAGLDLPYTPFQGFVARYFTAELPAETKTTGNGWGYGISFVLRGPFILFLEKRSLNYTSAATLDGTVVERKIEQYYVALSFLML